MDDESAGSHSSKAGRNADNGESTNDGTEGCSVTTDTERVDGKTDTESTGDASTSRTDSGETTGSGRDMQESAEITALRERVEAEYDFEEFGPSDMARMSSDEWSAAFDPESWITGDELLERVVDEVKSRIARREVFGIVERVRDGDRDAVLVYSDEGYVIVDGTGNVRGRGTVLRDVEPLVALAAMEAYDVPEPPEDWSLPRPEHVTDGSGEFGNLMMQVIAGVLLLAGIALLGATLFLGVETIIAPAIGLLFLVVGGFLFAMVANARLSDRFRAEEYRERLRTLHNAEARPDFVPVDGAVVTNDGEESR